MKAKRTAPQGNPRCHWINSCLMCSKGEAAHKYTATQAQSSWQEGLAGATECTNADAACRRDQPEGLARCVRCRPGRRRRLACPLPALLLLPGAAERARRRRGPPQVWTVLCGAALRHRRYQQVWARCTSAQPLAIALPTWPSGMLFAIASLPRCMGWAPSSEH